MRMPNPILSDSCKRIFLTLFLIYFFTTNALASDLITNKISVPSNSVVKNESFKPKFEICNINIYDALSNEWHVVVKILDMNENLVFSETVGGVFLAKGSSQNPSCVTLQTSSSFTPTLTGNHTITVDVNYSQDINTGNDKKTKIFSVTNPPSYNISGNILEDVNYGGNFGSYTGTPRPNVVVELYDNSGSFISTTMTNNSGKYSFSDISAGNYIVRAANYSVTSSRPRNGGAELEPIPVQTYRTDASSGTPIDVVNKVGGEVPSKVDAPINSGGQNLSGLTNGNSTPQSITNVKVINSDISGVNFVFNFSTIVNTNSEAQGSLRQFIINSNALSNNGLAQTGQTSGTESSIFMIPSTSDPLSRPADPNFNGSTFNIMPTSELPPITDKVTIDGFIQTSLSGNTHPDRPEVLLDGSMAGETSTGINFLINECRLTGLIIQKFGANGIFCNSFIRLGTANEKEKSVECLSNGFNGIQSKSVDYIGDAVLLLEENGQDGIKVENDLDVDGISSNKNGGWGVYFGNNFIVRRDIAQRTYIWSNGLGGISGVNGLLSVIYLDCRDNGKSASEREGHGTVVKTAYLKGATFFNNNGDGIKAETINHTEVDGLEKLESFKNEGHGVNVSGTMTADGVNIQENKGWGIISESGNVYIVKDSKNIRNYVWKNGKGGISVSSGIFSGKFMHLTNNGESASSSSEGYGIIAKKINVHGCEIARSQNDGMRAESITHKGILGQDNLLVLKNGGYGIRATGNIITDGIFSDGNEGWGVYSENGSVNIKLAKARNYSSNNKLGGISAIKGSVVGKWLFTSGNGESASTSSEGHGIIAGRVNVQELGNSHNKGDGIRAQVVNVSRGFSITDNNGYGIIGSKVNAEGIQISRNKLGGIKIVRNVPLNMNLQKLAASNENNEFESTILNSTISDNQGIGVEVEFSNSIHIENNNILRNNEYDVFSGTKNLIVNNNYWGNNSLPNSVNHLVSVENWLSDSLNLIILSDDNYLFPIGKSDSITFSVANITNLKDSLLVEVSDSLNWFEDFAFSAGIDDSSSANGLIKFSIPNSSVEMNKITISTTSLLSGQKLHKNLIVSSYTPIYSDIKILEDSLTIGFGDTIHFNALRIDNNGKETSFEPNWSSTQGLINEQGMFISDSTSASVEITAGDIESGLSKSTHIYVTDQQQRLTSISISPKIINISEGDVIEFKAKGKNQFDFPMEFDQAWQATGGSVDLNGLFIAGEIGGNYQISVSDTSGTIISEATINIVVGIKVNEKIPESFSLSQNFPNPFNPSTTIKYTIPLNTRFEIQDVRLIVYDILGREAATLVNDKQKAGNYVVEWNAENLTSGVYFYQLNAGDYIETKKMILLK